jgi:hypothetical protein
MYLFIINLIELIHRKEANKMTVELIRDMAKIKAIKNHLKGLDKKYYILFNFDLNTGLRI